MFPDPRLQRLIELALLNNRDLRLAALNVQAVQVQYGISTRRNTRLLRPPAARPGRCGWRGACRASTAGPGFPERRGDARPAMARSHGGGNMWVMR